MSAQLAFWVLSIAVSVLFVVVGFVLGYAHWGRASHAGKTLRKLRDALAFEKRERMRLARDHFDASATMKRLEEELKVRYAAGQMDASADATLKGDYDRVRQELSDRKGRIADLQAELSMVQAEMDELREGGENPRRSRLNVEGESLQEVLEGIGKMDGIEMALVADDHGLVVDATDGEFPAENLALLSSMVTGLGQDISEVLPVGAIAHASLGDDSGLTLETRSFTLFDVRCCLILVLRDATSYPHLAREASEAIVKRLG